MRRRVSTPGLAAAWPSGPAPWLLAVALLAATASAQPIAPAAQDLTRRPERSRALPALAVSAGATAGGLGLAYAVLRVEALQAGVNDPGPAAFLTVATLAPAAGNLWLGAHRDAAVGTALRAAGVGAVAYGFTRLDDGECGECYDEGGDAEPSGANVNARSDAWIYAGAALFASGAVYDVVTQVHNGRPRRVRLAPTGAGLAVSVGL